MADNEFSQQLKRLRREVGLTQQQFADQLNVHIQTISKWERGISEPDISVLGDIAKLFNVSVSYLVFGKDEPATDGSFDAEKFARNLSELRRDKKVNQKTLADYLSVSADTVSKWERAKSCPDIALIGKIAEYFNVSISQLYFGEAKFEQSVILEVAVPSPRRPFLPYLLATIFVLLSVVVGFTLFFINTGSTFPHADTFLGETDDTNFEKPFEAELEKVPEPHTHQFGDWIVLQQPNCTNSGIKYRLCASCKKEERDTILATGHNYSEVTYQSTCAERGFLEKVCRECSESYIVEYLPLAAHTIETVSGLEPTCTQDGLSEGQLCSVCKKVIVAQNTLPPAEHRFGEWIVDVQPDCLNKGSKYRTCIKCNKEERKALPALGHIYIDRVHQSTCVEQGFLEKVCTACGDSYIAKYFPLTEHTIEVLQGLEPTCMQSGLSEGKRCNVCRKVFVMQDTLLPVGHHFEGARCTTCGFKVSPTEDKFFTFETLFDGSYAVCGRAGVQLPQEVVIPWEHNGSKVTRIANGVIGKDQTVVSIVIPASIKKIEQGGIEGNKNLQAVYYMGDLRDWLNVSIDEYNFMYAHSLYFNYLPVTELEFEGVSMIPRNHFNYCSGIRSIRFSDSVTEIEAYAFENCINVQEVFISYSVRIIGAYAFLGLRNAKIFCEAPIRPIGWDVDWNHLAYNVVWGSDN